MSTVAAIPPEAPRKAEVTPDELLTMPNAEHYELVDGVPVERTVSLLASRVEITRGRILDLHCIQNDLGWVLGPACGYQMFPLETASGSPSGHLLHGAGAAPFRGSMVRGVRHHSP
jgi:hypothetical protein